MTDFANDISRCLFFDIETLETDRQAIIDYIDAGITHPGTMSKDETIAAWVAEKRLDVVREAVAKTALEGGYGRIASIAFAVGDEDVKAATSARAALENVPAGYDAELERKLLMRFWSAADRIREQIGRPPTLVGHGIVGFDVRWLWKRSVVLDVRPPTWWPLNAKPWETSAVFDTMVGWEGTGGRISQDRLCLALGLPLKTDLDGSRVGEAWRNGEFERIRSYNADDVRTVREIWKRITGWKAPSVAETTAERDATITEAVRTSQNGSATVPPAFDTEVVDVGTQTLDRPIRTGVGFRPGRAVQTGAAA